MVKTAKDVQSIECQYLKGVKDVSDLRLAL